MRRPPRVRNAPFLTKDRLYLMFGQGSFLAFIAMFAFVYCLYGMDLNLERARTLTFTIVVFSQLVHALNCRHDRRSLFSLGLLSNEALLWAVGIGALLQVAIVLTPIIQPIFKVTSFDPVHWLLALGIGLLPLLAMETWKWVIRSAD